MKIRYSKERLNSNYKLGLYFVIVGTILAIVFTIFSDSNKFELDSAGIGLIAAGIFSLVHYYYEKKKQYLTIKNGILTKNSLIPKKINYCKHTTNRYLSHKMSWFNCMPYRL